MFELTFIWHDCFLFQTPQCALLFDFWREEPPRPTDTPPGFLSALPEGLPLYILVSHHHKDHFVADVLKWDFGTRPVRWILSKDTAKAVRYMLKPGTTYCGPRPAPARVTVLANYETYRDELLCVKAFGSTDIGNSYVVETQGKRIFHAGDLNCWMWKDESTAAEIAAAKRDYDEKLLPIERDGDRFDLAMFPVDSRIGTDYWEGAAEFVRRFDVARFVPMHFCLADEKRTVEERKEDAAVFPEYANPERGDYIALLSPGDRLAFS